MLITSAGTNTFDDLARFCCISLDFPAAINVFGETKLKICIIILISHKCPVVTSVFIHLLLSLSLSFSSKSFKKRIMRALTIRLNASRHRSILAQFNVSFVTTVPNPFEFCCTYGNRSGNKLVTSNNNLRIGNDTSDFKAGKQLINMTMEAYPNDIANDSPSFEVLLISISPSKSASCIPGSIP